MDNKLFLEEVFGFESAPAVPAKLDESTIDAEEPGANRTYVPRIELEKMSPAEALGNLAWDDEVSVSLEKRAPKTEADRLGITRTDIVEENGERLAKAFNAAGELVAVRVL